MDKDAFQESVEYEQLTQAIYQAILDNEGNNIEVQHNIELQGRSGVKHQIDVFWRFKQGGIEHMVLIECKNYASCLTLEKARSFFGVIHDIGNVRGIMVTKNGYQRGAVDFAKFYGISLKLLRKPNELDWQGRIKDIHISITAKVLAADPPLTAEIILHSDDESQQARLRFLEQNGRLLTSFGPSLCLLDSTGNTTSDEMRHWLPKQLAVLDKEAGGPYTQEIDLVDKYIIVNEDEPSRELVKVDKIIATYYVAALTEEVRSYGEQVVSTILKDAFTGTVEHVQRK